MTVNAVNAVGEAMIREYPTTLALVIRIFNIRLIGDALGRRNNRSICIDAVITYSVKILRLGNFRISVRKAVAAKFCLSFDLPRVELRAIAMCAASACGQTTGTPN